jgi:leucyl aminopeptidase
MRITPIILTLLLALPVLASAELRPQFAGLDDLTISGTLVIPLAEGGKLPPKLETTLTEELQKAIDAADFKGKKGKILTLYSVASYDRVVVAGVGGKIPAAHDLQNLGGAIVKATGTDETERVNILWSGLEADTDFPAAHIALGLQLGAYNFDKYKSADEDEDEAAPETRFVIHTEFSQDTAQYWSNNLAPVAEGVFFARDLINEPANVIYPQSFVDRSLTAFKGVANVSIKVLDVKQMDKLGMGALLGVGMGSERPPRLLVITYLGGNQDEPPLAFVGKGVTFDSGGISLKSPKGMWRMKYDMSGAAAATGTLLTLAKRKAPVNAVAVAALVENMPSQQAQRPGDVRTTMSGKTVEVINTDAEGRLILSDAVWYTQQEFAPIIMVDLATLTGSIKVALGETYAGVFSRQDELAKQLIASGKAAGEEVWRMPLHADFRKAIKSDIADVKNSVEGGYGGASTGAEFIGTFVEQETVWAHLDIAGKAWGSKSTSTNPKGAVGWGVRLLNQLVLDYYQPVSTAD